MDRFGLDRLVCEVTAPPALSSFLWYELDIDRVAVPSKWAVDASVIAATRAPAGSALADRLADTLVGPVTHLQFEVDSNWVAAGDMIARCAAAGRSAIPAKHLSAPVTKAELRAAAGALAELAAPIVKLVYPAPTADALRAGLTLLDDWPDDAPALSLTPTGSRQGRLAAALSGSRLVYAPSTTTNERMSASWYHDLIAPVQQTEPTWLT